MLHNYLTVNEILYKWKIVESPRCSYCFLSNESVEHLFCHCKEGITLYRNTEHWASEMGLQMPPINVDNIILQNLQSDVNDKYIINLFILQYKIMLFENKEKVNENSIFAFKAKIAYIEKIEKTIAKKNNKYGLHIKKWTKYLIYQSLNT